MSEKKAKKQIVKELIKEAGIKPSILDNPEINYQNLNQGIFKGKWYFGKLFFDKQFGKFLKGLIFDNKTLVHNEIEMRINKRTKKTTFEEIYNIERLGIDFNHDLEINKNYWENNSIKEWLNSKTRLNPKQFYKKIFDKIDYFMDVKNENIIHLASCWIIGSYFYELFESYGYLYFNALRDSGKSKFKKVLRLIGFNGQEASSITEASFFRTIENTKGVLCIDEYERMDSERKKLTDMLLNAGIEKGAIVKRCEGTAHRNKDFDVYCPKIICNITGLNPTTQSRCITIKLFRTKKIKGKRKPSAIDKEFQEIRNLCYIFALENWNEIKKIYEDYNVENLWNRNEDLWKPLFSIAKFFGEDIENKLIDISNEITQEIKTEDISNDLTYDILIKILENFTSEEEQEIETSKVKEWLNRDFGDKSPEKVIGWRLSSLNIFEKFSSGKKTGYKLSPSLIVKALYSRDYPIPKDFKHYLEELEKV